MKKVYLHVGTHKTGTTALQRFSRKNDEILKTKGVFYPDYQPFGFPLKDGHHSFAHALSGNPNSKIKENQISTIVEHWQEVLKESNMSMLVSAEAIYRHCIGEGNFHEKRLMYLRKLKKVLYDFDVEVVLVFRRPDNYLRSLYQEGITNTTKVFPSFLEWIYSPQRNGVNYFERAMEFHEVFGNVNCLIYEDLVSSQDFYANFFGSININIEGVDSNKGVARKSLSVPSTLVKNYANKFIISQEQNKNFIKWLRKKHINNEIIEIFGEARYDFWSGPVERNKFLESRDDDLKKLQEFFFSERTSCLFPSLEEEKALPQVPPIPERAKNLVRTFFND